MPGHRGIFLLGQCVCVYVWWRGTGTGDGGMEWDQGNGISKLQLENFPSSKELLKRHPRLQTSTLLLLSVCSIKHAETFWGYALNSVMSVRFFFYLACSSCDYLETWVLCLCMFVSVFPLTLHWAAAGPGAVPVDQVSLCLCLVL